MMRRDKEDKQAQEKPENKVGGHRLKKRKFKKPIVALIVIAALLIIGVAAYNSIVRAPEVPIVPITSDNPGGNDSGPIMLGDRKKDFYTFLICGTDDGNGNTDTIMVAAFDVKNKKLNMVSVPRDTMINVSWKIKKINSAYGVGGVERLKTELAKLLGFTVDYYIKVDLEAFVKVVDTIGGVDFDVPIHMNYDDPTQDLHIHIDKGMQHLTGEQAIGVVRFRKGYPDADLGRINTQQAFVKALAEQCLKIGNITKIKQFSNIFSEYVDSDLTVGNMIWFGQQFMKLDSEDINFFTLPNSTGTYKRQSYVTLHTDELIKLINERFNPYVQDVTSGQLDIVTINSNGSLSSSTGDMAGGSSGATESTPKPAITTPPTDTPTPTAAPVMTPTPTATPEPTPEPTPAPTLEPTPAPTPAPTTEPTEQPNPEPTAEQTMVTPAPTSVPGA